MINCQLVCEKSPSLQYQIIVMAMFVIFKICINFLTPVTYLALNNCFFWKLHFSYPHPGVTNIPRTQGQVYPSMFFSQKAVNGT
jgi:hypothetical protein